MTLFDVPTETEPFDRAAKLSADGVYRYQLMRWWRTGLDIQIDLWIMCNPAKADALVDDNTITRCTGFSRRFGSDGFAVVNAYAYRATDPADMWRARAAGVDIVGPENDQWIYAAAHAFTRGRVIVAWGAHPEPERCYQVVQILRDAGRTPLCLGTTKAGMPRHPLMLPRDTELQPWTWRDAA